MTGHSGQEEHRGEDSDLEPDRGLHAREQDRERCAHDRDQGDGDRCAAMAVLPGEDDDVSTTKLELQKDSR